MFNILAKDFDRFFLGFDNQFDRLSKLHDELTRNIPNYPPYNIKKIGDNKYIIEMAVAGFSKTDIEIILEDNKLVIKGKHNDADNETTHDTTYLFKGLAERAFTHTFSVSDTIEIQNAELINGILKIFMENIIPEHKKPRKIEVGTKEEKSEKQQLNG